VRPLLQCYYPELDLKENKVIDILLVDSEIKSGSTAVKYQQDIAKHYQNQEFTPRVIYIALGGVLDKTICQKDILKSDDFGYQIPSGSDYKPAFVAFYFDHPFDAPGGMK
jgi:hypothetical protein